jgi:hypothetical protein
LLRHGGMVGGEFGEKVPVIREATGSFRTARASGHEERPAKTPSDTARGRCGKFAGRPAMGITQGYTLSYRLKLHLASSNAGSSVAFRQVAERPHRKERSWVNGAHGCDSFAADVAAGDGQREETDDFRQRRRAKTVGSYLMLLGKRDILHGGVLAAVTGQDTSSPAGC